MTSPQSSSPSRRSVLKGAAWSVPVLAVAVAAPPAAAASVTGSFTVARSPLGDALLNNATVFLTVDAVAGSPADTVTLVLTWNGGVFTVDFPFGNPGWTVTTTASSVTAVSSTTITGGGTKSFNFRAHNTTGSAAQTISYQVSAPQYSTFSSDVTVVP
ncbi:MAG: hypothetical protein ABJB03_03505 [Rhodoglobus sp.]